MSALEVCVVDGVTLVYDVLCKDDSLVLGLFDDVISSNREINSEIITLHRLLGMMLTNFCIHVKYKTIHLFKNCCGCISNIAIQDRPTLSMPNYWYWK